MSNFDLLKSLCLLDAPSGCEVEVREFIKSRVGGICDRAETDRLGNLYCYFDVSPSATTLMVSAHMDEVGLIVCGYDKSGLLKFGKIGGIDNRVLCGRNVRLLTKHGKINGVVSAKSIHLQSKEERETTTETDKMFIDIGAKDKADAEALVGIGDVAVFDSDFVFFGKDDSYIKAKAVDDRFGCAVMLDTMRELYKNKNALPHNIVFAFTVREEVGISGASAAAYKIEPRYSIVLESTAVADIAGTPPHKRVARLGDGGALSLMDRGTIYDREFADAAMLIAKSENIKYQIKQYVSGGNDAMHIQRTKGGAKVLALSVPTRYLHTASCVIHKDDYENVKAFLSALITKGEYK